MIALDISSCTYQVIGIKTFAIHAIHVSIYFFQVALSALDLDYHARDKLIRLVGTRYNHNTDEISIVTDR